MSVDDCERDEEEDVEREGDRDGDGGDRARDPLEMRVCEWLRRTPCPTGWWCSTSFAAIAMGKPLGLRRGSGTPPCVTTMGTITRLPSVNGSGGSFFTVFSSKFSSSIFGLFERFETEHCRLD